MCSGVRAVKIAEKATPRARTSIESLQSVSKRNISLPGILENSREPRECRVSQRCHAVLASPPAPPAWPRLKLPPGGPVCFLIPCSPGIVFVCFHLSGVS